MAEYGKRKISNMHDWFFDGYKAVQVVEDGKKQPDKGLSGQCLHARALEFTHPRSGERVHLTSPLPDYFLQFLSRLGEPEA